MATTEKTLLTVSTTVNAPVSIVWNTWNDPKHVVKWNAATPEWHTPSAQNDFRPGGKFSYRMEAKDGSFGFDFGGEYTVIKPEQYIEYVLGDGRVVQTTFESHGHETFINESFEAESENPLEMQQKGWQAILDNFKKYTESLNKLEKLHFNISINASAQEVYNKMLDEKSYREWTSEFNPTSNYIGSWDKGSKILFVGTDEKGEKGGMISRIKENIPGKFVSIEHLGILKGDQEILEGPEVDAWKGCLENYTFTESNGQTIVSVDVDSNQEFKNYFSETWPKALQKLKSITE
jgi:uncharacterized protein YndB with AHSA1/START domain